MKIKNIAIKNYRSFKDCSIALDDYTSFVGPNGAGKSTILCALNIFFREAEGSPVSVSELDKEDFNGSDTRDPIEITVTFGDLSAEAQHDFAEYYRQNELVVTARAVFDEATGTAAVRQWGQRRAMKRFSKFFELYNGGAPVADLRAEYDKIRTEIQILRAVSTKEGMRSALREYEEAHPDKCMLIPSEDQFYGFSKGSNRLAKYVQWIYVPAVKDVTKENVEARNTALGRILARTVRAKVKFEDDLKRIRDSALEKYRELLDSQGSVLQGLSRSLSEKMQRWAHPEAKARLIWSEDPKKSVQIDEPVARLLASEGAFEGDLVRFGHGLQRSYLLALLQELASADDRDAPTLILGCEEPELYQHPPQARHLASVLQTLSGGNAQVLVSTHSPLFVSGRYFESIRMVRRNSKSNCSGVTYVDFETIANRIAAVWGERPIKPPAQQARLHQALQPHLNEMFFARKLVFVEGLEDQAYLTSWLVLSEEWENFRRLGAHIIPVNGKGYLLEPSAIAESLGIPTFVVFDADGNITNKDVRPKHEKDNKALLSVLGGNPNIPFPIDTVWGDRFVQWPSNFGNVRRDEVGAADWDRAFGRATKNLGDPTGSYAKNPIHIGKHIEILWNEGKEPPSLERLGREMLRFLSSS
jgi:predicted ATP-dependent endonuclease of OLD family